MPYARLGKIQSGSATPESFAVYGFRGGLNIQATPQQVADDELTVAYNGYLRADGGFQMRNGMTLRRTVTGAGAVLGLARFYQEVKNGAIVSPATAITLAQVNSTLYNADTSTAIGSIGASNPMTWVRAQDPNDPNFVGGLTDVIVICTGSGGPYVYDGTNLYTPAGWSAASGASWCAIVNGVIWFGGIPATPNQIFGTGTGQPADASMETLPASRNFVFSGPVMGLCAQGTGATAALVVGLNQGISVLSGTGYTNYYLQDIPMRDGVTAGRTMVYDNGYMYWLGHDSVWQFDGQSPPIRISDKIDPWIQNDTFYPGYPIQNNRNLSWCFVYKNILHLGYCTLGATVPNAILCFDLVVRGWTVLQTNPGLYCMALLDAPSDANPSAPIVGSSASAVVYNWDVEPAVGSAATDAGVAIIAQMQTKYFKIGVPGTNKMLLRVYPEFFLSGPITATFDVSTDYGLNSFATVIGVPYPSGAQWDVAQWDVDLWGTGQVFNPYGFPRSRIDYAVQADSFSFGVTTLGSSAPWIIQGLTSDYSQKAAT